jgi:hypothetical protein
MGVAAPRLGEIRAAGAWGYASAVDAGNDALTSHYRRPAARSGPYGTRTRAARRAERSEVLDPTESRIQQWVVASACPVPGDARQLCAS